MSPLLFNILTYDLGEIIKKHTRERLYVYANDMTLASEDIADLQDTVNQLSK